MEIRRLDEVTINRIAAGEVIQRPAGVVKELLENSLDAGATIITVGVKGGGLQAIQIQDNGHGIRSEHMAIVCERFTTSKISSFDDLQTTSTFGFRGEALASVSHVAQVTITSKTESQTCAYKAKYSDGKLCPFKMGDKATPKPCAGTIGTNILVEDLFFNMKTRRNAFKNVNEEYNKILEVVTRYAIHYGDKNIQFTCKKLDSTPDLHTMYSTLDNIKCVYGAEVSRELLPLSFASEDIVPQTSRYALLSSCTDSLTYSLTGYVSNANYNYRKNILIIFINNRLVEHAGIKKVVDTAYTPLLPKHTHPFIYLSIIMPTQHVDINVHPTKKEVHFLHESVFLDQLYAALQDALKNANHSRVFYTQAVLAKTTKTDITESIDRTQPTKQQVAPSIDAKEQLDRVVMDVLDSSDSDGGWTENRASSNTNVAMHQFTQLTAARNSANCRSNTSTLLSDNKSSVEVLDDSDSDGEWTENRAFPSNNEAIQQFTELTATRKSINPSNSTSPLLHNILREASKPKGMSSSRPPPHKLVRTDPSTMRIDTFFHRTTTSTKTNSVAKTSPSPEVVLCGTCSVPIATGCACCQDDSNKRKYEVIATPTSDEVISSIMKYQPLPASSCSNRSIISLVEDISGGVHDALQRIVQSHTFVGVVNDSHVLLQVYIYACEQQSHVMQFETKLLLMNYRLVISHMFYQVCLRQAGGMPLLALPERQPLKLLIEIARPYAEKEEIDNAVKNLIHNIGILDSLFSIGITIDGYLLHVPHLLNGFTPEPHALPEFLSLIANIGFDDSKLCYHQCATHIALFYTSSLPHIAENTSSAEIDFVNRVMMPAIKCHLQPQRSFVGEKLFVEIASLDQLYKVFERC